MRIATALTLALLTGLSITGPALSDSSVMQPMSPCCRQVIN